MAHILLAVASVVVVVMAIVESSRSKLDTQLHQVQSELRALCRQVSAMQSPRPKKVGLDLSRAYVSNNMIVIPPPNLETNTGSMYGPRNPEVDQ